MSGVGVGVSRGCVAVGGVVGVLVSVEVGGGVTVYVGTGGMIIIAGGNVGVPRTKRIVPQADEFKTTVHIISVKRLRCDLKPNSSPCFIFVNLSNRNGFTPGEFCSLLERLGIEG